MMFEFVIIILLGFISICCYCIHENLMVIAKIMFKDMKIDARNMNYEKEKV